MELITVPTASFSQRYRPSRALTSAQWAAYKRELASQGCTVVGGPYDYTVTWPEGEHTYAPTLALVHRWLHSDWGPFYVSWRSGRLCPFHPLVGTRNMTCCPGNIKRPRCCGLILEERHVAHLPVLKQHRLRGRVVC